MFAKIENDRFMEAPSFLIVGDTKVWNASTDDHIAQGWYPVIFTDEPDTEEGFHAEFSWIQDEDRIVQTWTIVQDEPPIETLFNILLGEE